MLAPFFTTGSGLQKQITSVRTGLKSLEELERENSALQVENRQLRATNQALRDVEHEVNRLRHALELSGALGLQTGAGRDCRRAILRPGGTRSRSIAAKRITSTATCRW